MGKLNQLLAVEGDLKGVANNVINETRNNFKSHPDRYFQTHQRVENFDEDETKEADTHKRMDDTVVDKLEYTAKQYTKYLDAWFQKEATNQEAMADIVIEGHTLATNIPATFLLGLESKLSILRDTVYRSIPTLQPGVFWDPDPDMPDGVKKRRHPEERFRTKKVRQNHVLALATKEHPEQVQVYTEDIKVARVITDTWCSLLSSKEKSELLERVDNLIAAVKKARQKANEAEVKKVSIGDTLFNYIHNK